MRLEGETAIVTGAARGIGRAIALHLTGEGCHTVLVDREPSHEVERTIKKMGGQCIGVTIDVSRIEAVQKMVKRAVEKFGRIDILVNNAGIIHRGDFKGMNRDFGIYDPLDFLAAVTAHIPDRREHMVRYYGWYSSVKRGKRRKARLEKPELDSVEVVKESLILIGPRGAVDSPISD